MHCQRWRLQSDRWFNVINNCSGEAKACTSDGSKRAASLSNNQALGLTSARTADQHPSALLVVESRLEVKVDACAA
jgi:hypothetical protein